jgi:glucan 1,3-beta-glucosidase
MRPFFFLAFASLAFAIDANHEPEWVKSVVASASSAYAPYFTEASKVVERQVRPPRSSGRPGYSDPQPYYPVHPSFNGTSSINGSCSFWLEQIQHQGKAPYQSDATYQVFRNVKDFGATGDGVTDDTAAINLAISSGDRCGPGSCNSSTTTPALVYFPPGDYLVSSSIINYYDTQIIGNPNCLPTILASSSLTGWVIDSSGFGATNTFFRQIRNLVIDMTAVAPEVAVTGIFWPTAQATRLQNLVFKMSEASGTQHQGVFISEGSGGIINDLVAYGGRKSLCPPYPKLD